MTKYAESLNPRENRKKTKFGNPKIIMGGKQQDLRRMINENAKDTKIYEQIDKYGLNPISEPTVEEAITDWTQLAGNLRDSIEKGMEAKRQWGKLPKEIRQNFNNDINEFMVNGPNWMKQQYENMIKKNQKVETKPIENKGNENVTE